MVFVDEKRDTVLHAHVHLVDLESGDDLGDVDAVAISVRWALGKADVVGLTIANTDGTAKAAFDRAQVSGNVVAEVIAGTRVLGRKALIHPSYDIAQPGTLIDSGPSICDLYDGLPIDRITAYNTRVGDTLAAMFANSPGWPTPFQDPYYRCDVVCDPAAVDLTLSEDIDALSCMKALDILARDLGAQLGPERGQWWTDSGDRTFHVAELPDATVATFGDGDGALQILRRTTLDVDWEDTAAAVKMRGGPSSHGLPAGSRCTGMIAVSAPGGEGDATFVIGVFAGETLGGAFYLTPDLLFHPLSQNMGVTCMWLDDARGIVYLGTKRGVYERTIAEGVGIFKQTGGFAGSVRRVFVDKQSTGLDPEGHPTVGAQVYIISDDPATGLHGLFTYPAINPDELPDTLGLGFDYWSRMAIKDDCFAGSAYANTVYYCLGSDPTKVKRVDNLHDPTLEKVTTTIGVPDLYPVTDLVRVDDGTYVLTTGGSKGFYKILTNGATMVPDNALLPGLVITDVIQGADGKVYALTDEGPYVRRDDGWHPVSDVGGLGAVSTEHFAVGIPPLDVQIFVPVLGAVIDTSIVVSQLMLASAGAAIYASVSGGKYWTEITALPTSVGTYLRDVGIPAASDPLFTWVVGADGQGMPTYTLVKRDPPFAPGAACEFADAVEIADDVNTSPERASAALGILARRYLAHRSIPIGGSQEVEGWFDDDTGTALLDLRPTMQVEMIWQDPPCNGWPGQVFGQTFRVIEHEVIVDENGGHSHTVLGSSTATKKYTAEELGSSILYTLSRHIRQ